MDHLFKCKDLTVPSIIVTGAAYAFMIGALLTISVLTAAILKYVSLRTGRSVDSYLRGEFTHEAANNLSNALIDHGESSIYLCNTLCYINLSLASLFFRDVDRKGLREYATRTLESVHNRHIMRQRHANTMVSYPGM